MILKKKILICNNEIWVKKEREFCEQDSSPNKQIGVWKSVFGRLVIFKIDAI